MIVYYGMTEVSGLMVLDDFTRRSSFLGGGASGGDYSEEMAQKMDNYIKAVLDERFAFVKKTL